MKIDAKILEFIKQSKFLTAALAVAAYIIIYLIQVGYIPTDSSPYWLAIPKICLVVFGCLTIFNVLEMGYKILDPITTIRTWRLRKYEVQGIKKYIPYMTEKEKEIIGHLLHRDQKVFTTTIDGGYAVTLISKGYIRRPNTHAYAHDQFSVPFEIPDHIWEVLIEKKQEFPDTGNNGIASPWTIPYMAR